MKAVVLVGGFGTRLLPLTATRPKQMLPIVDRPMIEHVMAGLAAHGVTDAVLSLGYLPEAFTAHYPDGRCGGVNLHYATEPEPLDTAGAIAFAARHVGIDETFLAVNGDVMTDIDLGALFAFHQGNAGEATIALTPVDDPSRYGVVPIDESGLVQGFIEKPPPGTASTNWINAGLYVFEPSVLDRIPVGRRVSVERETFPALVDDAALYARHDDAYWIDAGTPATYVAAQLDLVGGRRHVRMTAVSESADLADGVDLEASIVMAGAAVGSGTRLERSVVMADARVADGCMIVDSVIGARSSIGSGCQIIGGSLVGDDEVVAPGTLLDDERVPKP